MPDATPLPILSCTTERLGGQPVLRPVGTLDEAGGAVLRHSIDELIAAGSRRIVLDLSGLRYIASAGIALLIQTQKRLRAEDGGVLLAQPSDAVQEVLVVLNLASIVPVYATLDEAVLAAAGVIR